MATRFWVGGTGTWDATTTTNWAASSGGAGGASAPTAADDVVFDAASNVALLAFTVTVGTGAVCQNFSTGGAGGALDGAMTLAGSAAWSVYGSLTYPAANLTRTYTGTITFAATATGKTITTNGVTLTAGSVVFDGVGGEWTLGSALTVTTDITVTNGAFSTGNFAVAAANLLSSNSNTRSINLGSSALTLSGSTPITFTTSTNLTLTAGTSTITCSGASPTFSGGGLTFYNVSFTTVGASTKTISGANTFNNLSITSTTGTRETTLIFNSNNTVSGTLTLGAPATAVNRMFVRSGVPAAASTLTVAAVAALSDADLKDIAVTGASAPWSGTRLGDCGGNSGITFATGVNKYWNLVAGGNWSDTAWALTSGGAVAAANYPLPQDTAIIGNTGLTAGNTITIQNNWQIGTLDASGRTLAATLSIGGGFLYGNFTLSTSVTPAGSGTFLVGGRGTQTITPAGRTFTNPWTLQSANGIISFAGAVTSTSTITISQGTIRFLAGSTNTATTFVVAGGAATPAYLTSSTPGTQFTLSQATGTVSAVNTTISDSNATGGATWQGLSANNAIDAGNNTGWVFDIPFGGIVFQQPVRLRSFTERGRD